MDKIVVILGPTSSGKTDLSIKVAKDWNGEIVSADSRQVYKNLDIGTGKITEIEKENIKHYMLDIASPLRRFTISRYSKLGLEAIAKILKNKKLPIICGGTGFYIDSLIYNNNFARIAPNKEIRRELEKLSLEELQNKLQKLDPERFSSIDVHNKIRLIRSLEIIISTNKKIPKQSFSPIFNYLKIGILWRKDELNKRIEKRLNERLEGGLIEEVQGLINKPAHKGLSYKRLYELGLEYRFVSLYLKGDLTYDEMRTKLLIAIQQYAKRQMTWFKRDKEIIWIKPEKILDANRLIKDFLEK